MARQTYYVTREQRHPLYKTRMLTAGQELPLDASAARLFRQLGVELSETHPRTVTSMARADADGSGNLLPPSPTPKPAPRKAAPRKRTTRKAKAKK
jgi:hypothetical protein